MIRHIARMLMRALPLLMLLIRQLLRALCRRRHGGCYAAHAAQERGYAADADFAAIALVYAFDAILLNTPRCRDCRAYLRY